MPSFPLTWFNLVDSSIGELNAAIDATQTSLVLKSGQGIKFPVSDFIFRCENEWVHCATRTTDTLSSLTRGYDGTTAVAHAVNTTVFQSAGKSFFQRLYDQIIGHTHTKAEIEAVLTGVITTHSHSGGSDPWTYVRLASDFPTTSATAVDVTGMNLAPAANLRYEIEGLLLLRTNTATVGPRPGIAWPTGMTDGVGMIDTTSAATTRLLTNGNVNAAMLAAVGGLPNTTQSWPAKIHATLIAGASPGSTFRIQLASETAGTTVTMKANSWFRWRTF